MELLTILMIVLAVSIYLQSSILSRQGLMYISLVQSTLSLAQVLIDKSLTNDELLISIFLPFALVLMTAISLSMGRYKQW